MRNFCVIIAVAALSLVLLSACGRSSGEDITPIQYALNAANTRRAGIVKPDYNMLLPFTEGREQIDYDMAKLIAEMGGEEYLVQFVANLLAPVERASSVTREQAIYDAEILLMLLRISYGAYTYYGGDEVFLPMFESIFDTLDTSRQWTAGRSGNFQLVLHTFISQVIADNHFTIGGRHLGSENYSPAHTTTYGTVATFFVGEIGFDFGNDRFRSRETDMYILEVVGHDVNELFRLSIDDEGELSYIPVLVVPGRDGGREFPITVVYENGEQEIVNLLRHNPTRRNYQSPSLKWVDEIPVVTIMSMQSYPNVPEARQFLAYAYELKNEPVVIVDVRSNHGGNNLLSAQWLHIMSGEVVPSNSVILQMGNHQETMEALAAVPSDSLQYRPIADFMTYHPTTPLGDYHFVWNYTADRLVPNDQLIILLTDRYTASAGEGFVDFVLNLENTLIIGQNTAGVAHKIAGAAFFLPNSGVPVHFGPGIAFFPEGLFAEGVGYAPDIWTVGDALDAALAFVKRNDLTFLGN